MNSFDVTKIDRNTLFTILNQKKTQCDRCVNMMHFDIKKNVYSCNFCGHSREKKKKKVNKNTCKKCNYGKLVYNYADSSYICDNCKSVSDSSTGKLVLTYDDKKVSHYGNPTDKFFPKSSQGIILKGSCSYVMKKFNNCYYNSHPKERSKKNIFSTILSFTRKNNIDKKVYHSIKIVINTLCEKKKENGRSIIIRGDNRIEILSGCFYYGALIEGILYLHSEISKITGLKKQEVRAGIRKFEKTMGADIYKFDLSKFNLSNFLSRRSHDLNIDQNIIDNTCTLYNNSKLINLDIGHQLISVISACLCLSYEHQNIKPLAKNKKIEIVKNISEKLDIAYDTVIRISKKFDRYYKYISNTRLVREKYNSKIQKNSISRIKKKKILKNIDNLKDLSVIKKEINKNLKIYLTKTDEINFMIIRILFINFKEKIDLDENHLTEIFKVSKDQYISYKRKINQLNNDL